MYRVRMTRGPVERC